MLSLSGISVPLQQRTVVHTTWQRKLVRPFLECLLEMPALCCRFHYHVRNTFAPGASAPDS